ncbi:unnamed protein product [Adineta steineri]|uniref:Uncharacterized protein n=1 Tax=Adineta steineri TaxID=433720 RepID=A0A813P212_9BILA|nr:unnamed protein product [Adineta steineri]CAF3983993.1 unnamed protein product [Adineta steineri]
MSTPQHKADSSLNNLPENNNNLSGTAGGSTSLTGTGKTSDVSTSLGTENSDGKVQAPIDKHGDTWGGGVPHVNKEFK